MPALWLFLDTTSQNKKVLVYLEIWEMNALILNFYLKISYPLPHHQKWSELSCQGKLFTNLKKKKKPKHSSPSPIFSLRLTDTCRLKSVLRYFFYLKKFSHLNTIKLDLKNQWIESFLWTLKIKIYGAKGSKYFNIFWNVKQKKKCHFPERDSKIPSW